MKLAFLLLLLVNVALYAWQQGAFGRFVESGREPERLARQIEPDRIRVLSEREVQTLRERASQARAAAATPAPLDLTAAQACVEFGDFPAADLSRAEAALVQLGLGSRQTTRAVEMPGYYMVYLPPFKTRQDADRAVLDLGKRGVKDVVVFNDGPLRLGVVLGSFREAEGAKAQAAALDKLGVKGVHVSEKPTAVVGTRFQLRELDAAAAQQLATIRKEFPAQSVRPCTTG